MQWRILFNFSILLLMKISIRIIVIVIVINCMTWCIYQRSSSTKWSISAQCSSSLIVCNVWWILSNMSLWLMLLLLIMFLCWLLSLFCTLHLLLCLWLQSRRRHLLKYLCSLSLLWSKCRLQLHGWWNIKAKGNSCGQSGLYHVWNFRTQFGQILGSKNERAVEEQWS